MCATVDDRDEILEVVATIVVAIPCGLNEAAYTPAACAARELQPGSVGSLAGRGEAPSGIPATCGGEGSMCWLSAP